MADCDLGGHKASLHGPTNLLWACKDCRNDFLMLKTARDSRVNEENAIAVGTAEALKFNRKIMQTLPIAGMITFVQESS